jgi:serine phosphatase RsbU (regulator of sigma subunit)
LNENEEFFMEERLAESVSKLVLENNTSNISGSIYDALKKFVGNHYQSDDITIVVLVVK